MTMTHQIDAPAVSGVPKEAFTWGVICHLAGLLCEPYRYPLTIRLVT